jgi:hypothetical protein
MPSPVDEFRVARSPEDLLAEVHRRADRRIRRRLLARAAAVVAVLALAGGIPFLLGDSDQATVQVGDPTGSGNTSTTTTRHPDVPPPTLPDGAPERILTTGPGRSISLLATDGTGVIRRLPIAMGDEATEWLAPVLLQASRDGGTAYFLLGTTCDRTDLLALRLTDGHLDTIASGAAATGTTAFAVSPDGTGLAVLRTRQCEQKTNPEVGELVVRDLASGRERVLATGEHLRYRTLSYSPDGRHLAFDVSDSNDNLNVRVDVVDLGSGAVRTVPAPDGCRFRTPQFLPRSDLLAVVEDCWQPGPVPGPLTEQLNRSGEISRRRDGGDRLVLVDPARGEVRRTVYDIPTDHSFGAYRFDARGEHLLFSIGVPIGPGRVQHDAHRLSLTDGSSHVLYQNPQPEETRLLGFVAW